MPSNDFPSPAAPPANQKWWHELTGYHWFVFVVAALGWLAGCMDQQLFVLARGQAVTELVMTSSMKETLDSATAAGRADEEKQLRDSLDKTVTHYATLST